LEMQHSSVIKLKGT